MTFLITADTSQVPQLSKAQPTFRAGAVARIAGMPVATLRIWEQRYQAVRPNTAASGHRLYSSADVERATLLRRLTAQGHAIGLLASLETKQMRQMIRALEVLQVNWDDTPVQTVWRTVVVGRALASRLQRLFERQPFGQKLQLVGVFDSLAASAQAAEHSAESTADILLWQAGSLQPDVYQELRLAQDAWRAPAAAVFYRFSSAAARAELTNIGAEVLSEPADDNSLRQWLVSLQRTHAQRGKADDVRGSIPPVSSAYLQHVAGSARMLFEKALEQVAIAEGLPLPPSTNASST